ncbi:hypothetical protein [Polaribacter sp.]|uniref:hypothetical protein n=1 Tax=Polaribacter sp. TaxID=1920175 RepID=UPI003F6C87BB
MNPLKKASVLLGFLLLTSCAENLNFSQIKDYVLQPILTSSLTFFSVQPSQFFDSNGVQQNSRQDITEFDLFQDSIISDNVVKMVFNATFKNEFDRGANIKIDLLNSSDDVVYNFSSIFIERRDLNPPAYEEEIILASNPDIFTATKVRIIASLENTGKPMNPLDTSEFEFKSSVTLFIATDF